MKRRLAVILAALLIAAMAGCQQSGTSSPADSSTVQSSADISVAESAESEISEAQSSVVSEVTSNESSGEKSEASKTESSDKSSKTESSQSKTEESSKKETSKAESSKTETSKTESSKSESSKAEEPKVTGINIDMSSLSITSGTSYELNAYILWSNGTSSYQGITWTTSNNSVASVSSSGYVTAKSAGTVTITASYGSFSKSCTVTVKAAQVSQPSQPSGGGSSGNGGSSGGNGGNGGNGGSTSQQSGGGNSGGGSSQTTKPSTPSTPETKKDDGSPRITQDWLKANCKAIKTEDGTVVYELPQLVPYINEYRRSMGRQEIEWIGMSFTYAEFLKELEKVKANTITTFIPYLCEDYPYCFDEAGNIILTESNYNKYYANPRNELAEELAYNLKHGMEHRGHSTTLQAMVRGDSIIDVVENCKSSPAHWGVWMNKTKHSFYACAVIGSDGTLYIGCQ